MTKYHSLQGAIALGNSNVAELSNITGLAAPVVQDLANKLGINLTQALNPAAVEAMTGYIAQQGGTAAVVGQEWQASSLAIQAAMELMAAKAAQAMPNVSTATRNMVASVQPNLITLVGSLQKSGDQGGAEFVSAFLANIPAAQLASKQMHDSVNSPLVPLESELRAIGDTSAANAIAAWISHVPGAAGAGKSLHDAVANPLQQLQSELAGYGDAGASGFVQDLLKHQPDAGQAGHGLNNAVVEALTGLAASLQQQGQTAAAALIDELVSQQGPAGAAALAIGGSVSGGIYAGISGGIPQIISAAQAAVNDALTAAHHAIDNPPYPSRLWREEIGQSMGAGIAAGLQDSSSLVRSAATLLVHPASVGALVGGLRGSGASAGGGITFSNTYHINVPGTAGNPQQVGAAVRRAVDESNDDLIRRLAAGTISSAGG